MSALGAFMKTVEIMKRENVVDHYWDYGRKLIAGMNQIAVNLGIQDFFYVEGYPCSPNYITKDNHGEISLAFRTLFAQLMLDKKVLMPYIAISFAHREEELKLTLSATEYALSIYKDALSNGYQDFLKSNIIKPVFRKYN